MAVGDEVMTEGSVSSFLLNSNQNSGSLSPEDVAWVDSCLIKDPEVPEGDWNSLKDALLEILNAQPNSLAQSEGRDKVFPSRADMEVLMSNDEADSDLLLPTTDDYPIPINEEEESCDYDISDNDQEEACKFWAGTHLGNIFLPGYNEEQQQRMENAADFGSLGEEAEQSADDIFKVWDLEIPAEEDDELILGLKKALSESSLPSTTSVAFDDLGHWKDLKGELLEDLVSGIADLSLGKKSG